MKIQSLIARPNGTTVTFDETDKWPAGHYEFKPDPTLPGAPHVAEVEDEAHLHRFLSLPDAFRMYIPADVNAPKVAPKRPSAAGIDRSGAVVPDKKDDADDEKNEVDPIVAEVRNLSIKDLKAKINTFPKEALAAALEQEKTRTDEPARKGWVEVVEAHLGVATA